ncbi:PTS sugar transporter subunit IIA [Clostridium beijerinckii]|uniref:Mannose/fructose-specific phosphotransferase system component IIA n=1 Tax=Clostridium beijerinckii TaxID=1520 RepID=A0AAX0AW92_CLOBE|nr:hypothetical protein [Clostridium beijerinckii]MBA8933881.1 mannose/fructose-specific phosphotransferase system component IIA [Clostridium beijerinckii]NRT36207.1 mannose/fructose-specific phosphotransferase system component IIA [Clostridium beijerinckii]NRT44366.1 mannose/fructose-specific phosphotransferase system component IIA [Clostridium beijerinckii]NRT86378.1 mannose/fructose-specific phosphotransferase system component IIA [Clostridium beijerinckii]NRU38075.1 mannose/fructose-specif
MTKIILISHGDLAKGMAQSAQMITGKKTNLSYYGLYPGEHPSEMINTIKNEAISSQENNYIVVADILGCSVCNAAMELINLENVKVISGMNLSLIINLLLSSEISDEILNEKITNAQNGIKLFSSTIVIKQNDDENEFF